MTLAMDPRLIAALLDWQAELGADEFIGDEPLDRFALHEAEMAARATRAPAPSGRQIAEPPAPPPKIDPVIEAQKLVNAATSLAHLSELQSDFPHCDLRKGARHFLFAQGQAGARVMILTDAPDPDEDRAGKLFVGRNGHLLDQMLAAIGLSRQAEDPAQGVYVLPTLPWRTPAGRAPEVDELAMMLPFLRRHIDLAAPEVILLMGTQAPAALLGERPRRGQWLEIAGRPALAMTHPRMLLRAPEAKREAWADLLSLKAKLNS